MTQHAEGSEFAAPEAAPAPSRNLLLVFWRRKALVAAGTVVGLVIGALVYAQYKPVYQSTAQVLVVKKSSGAMQLQGGDARVTVMEDYVATQLILIKSPFIIEGAVKKRDLQNLPSFQNKGDPVSSIKAALGAEREKDGSGSPNNIINLSYSGPVAEDCPTVLTAVIDSYKEFLDEKYRTVSDDTMLLITNGRNTMQTDLAEKVKAYKAFRLTSPLLWKGKDGINVQQERVAAIENGRSAQMIRRAKLRDRLKTIETAVKEGRPRGELLALAAEPEAAGEGDKAKPPAAHPLEDQLVLLQLQEQQLLEDYGEDHPQVHSVRKRIEMLRDFIAHPNAGKEGLGAEGAAAGPADPVEVCLQKLRLELFDAESQLQSLTELLDQEQTAARSLGTYEMEDENYRREIQNTQQMCDGIIKRLQEADMVREAGGFDAQAISRPAAGVKTSPNFLYILASGLLIGTVAGAGLAYLAELSDKGFRTADEIRRRLGLPVIGHVPMLAPDETAKANAEAGLTTLDPYLVCHYRPKSVEAEAYRAVRTALYFSTQGGGHTLVQVTSPDMGDGKSTLITNLAASIAQSGKKIILVDADLRRPRLHKMMGLAANLTGLSSVITGRAELADAVQETVVPGLFVLPCGPLPPNPSELLTAPRFKEVLDALRAQYDFVLVDTPPLLAVTDPCVVAPRVDGVLLTMRMSKNSRPKAERAREILSTLGVKVLGVIVNGVTRSKGTGNYGADQYEYSYGPNDYAPDEEAAPGSYYDETAEGTGAPADEGGEKVPAAGNAADKGATPVADAPERTSAAPPKRARRGHSGVWRLPMLAWILGWWA